MADDTIYHPHMEEAHMAVTLNNRAKIIPSDTTKLTNLIMANYNLAGKVKAKLAQNKVLTDLLRKNICGVTTTLSEK